MNFAVIGNSSLPRDEHCTKFSHQRHFLNQNKRTVFLVTGVQKIISVCTVPTKEPWIQKFSFSVYAIDEISTYIL